MSALLSMLPRLQSQEMLDTAGAVRLGAGAMSAADAGFAIWRLQRQARGERGAAAADPATLAAMGIEVVEA